MLSQTFRELIRPMEIVQRVVWYAFNGSTIVYVGVMYFLFGFSTDSAQVLRSNPLSFSICVLAVLTAIASLWIADLLLPKSRLRAVLGRQPVPEDLLRFHLTVPVDLERVAKIKSLPQEEQRILALVPLIYIAFIVQLAFGNAVALYGFVLSVTSQSAAAIVPFAILSLILNLRVSPNLDSWLERAAKRATQ